MEQATVLGATGGLGKAVVDALISKNYNTKILVRDIEKFKKLYPGGKLPGEVSVIQGDLDSNQSLALACEYSDTIFACFNTTYAKWNTDLTRWVSRVGDIAATLQANILFPGNVYNIGRVDKDPNFRVDEEHPQNAHTDKGQLRIALEQRLIRSAMEGATLTILRFPEFYGPAVLNRIISPVFINALKGKRCNWFGNPKVLHDFIYTRDAGKAMVKAALEPKAADTVLHVPGSQPITCEAFINKVYELSNTSLESNYEIISQWKLNLAGWVQKDVREFTEMLYLFEEPLILDGSKFNKIVGKMEYTTHDNAIKETLEWYKYWENL